MIKRGDKVICIKSIGNEDNLIFKENQTYNIVGIMSIHIFVERLNTEYAFGLEENYNGLRFKDYFMTYNDWLALERQKQIDSIFK